MLSSGTGEFDEERILRELPKQLSLPERRVKSVINGQASDRKRDVLVQAVSMLRQKKLNEVVKCLNNLLACNKVRHSLMSETHLKCYLAPCFAAKPSRVCQSTTQLYSPLGLSLCLCSHLAGDVLPLHGQMVITWAEN